MISGFWRRSARCSLREDRVGVPRIGAPQMRRDGEQNECRDEDQNRHARPPFVQGPLDSAAGRLAVSRGGAALVSRLDRKSMLVSLYHESCIMGATASPSLTRLAGIKDRVHFPQSRQSRIALPSGVRLPA